MNRVNRTARASSKSLPTMWLEILGIVLGVTTVFGLAVLRAEIRDRSTDSAVTPSSSLDLSTELVASQLQSLSVVPSTE